MDSPTLGVLADKPKPPEPIVGVLPTMSPPLQSPSGSIMSPTTEYSLLETPMTTAAGEEPEAAPRPQYLLVDDNPINLKILSAYMHKLGLTYQTATNGQEALDTFVRDPSRCRCVLMDISMPVMDGFQATRLIRAHESAADEATAPASIFALSGLASDHAQQEALWSGVDLFLTKPVKLKELGDILRSRGLLG